MIRVRMVRYNSTKYEPHAHEETSVTLILAGRLVERVGRVEEVARPLSLVVKPGDTVHSDVFGPGVATLQLVIHPAHAPALAREIPSLSGWRWMHGGPATRAFLELAELVTRAGSGAGRDVREHVQRAAFDALASLSTDDSRPPIGSAPAWLRRAKEQLDDRASPSVASCARDAGVHPVYLARQFRRWFGLSITDYRRRRRVQIAAEAIARSTERLSGVAVDAGFSDHAHLTRVFGAEVGRTPSAFRRVAQAAKRGDDELH